MTHRQQQSVPAQHAQLQRGTSTTEVEMGAVATAVASGLSKVEARGWCASSHSDRSEARCEPIYTTARALCWMDAAYARNGQAQEANQKKEPYNKA